ncbi:MAG: AhpC/TSA family protein [Planctomycetes bacterium]|nr:AhpC/TSA family protein [Planctomycetota bacterium]
MAQVCSHLPALRAAGARLAFVGSGTPSMARAFREEACLPSEVALLVDPDLAVYRALKLKRGVFSALSARSVAGAAKAWRAGHRQGKVLGDPWQNGGVFVVAPDGELLLAHVSQRSGDHPTSAALLGALGALSQ